MQDGLRSLLKTAAAYAIGAAIIHALGRYVGWWAVKGIALAGLGMVAHDLWQLRAGWWPK